METTQTITTYKNDELKAIQQSLGNCRDYCREHLPWKVMHDLSYQLHSFLLFGLWRWQLILENEKGSLYI